MVIRSIFMLAKYLTYYMCITEKVCQNWIFYEISRKLDTLLSQIINKNWRKSQGKGRFSAARTFSIAIRRRNHVSCPNLPGRAKFESNSILLRIFFFLKYLHFKGRTNHPIPTYMPAVSYRTVTEKGCQTNLRSNERVLIGFCLFLSRIFVREKLSFNISLFAHTANISTPVDSVDFHFFKLPKSSPYIFISYIHIFILVYIYMYK